MDILVRPSEREGFPRVIYEAMLTGAAVIAYKTEAIRVQTKRA